jgi:hypothetical protein
MTARMSKALDKAGEPYSPESHSRLPIYENLKLGREEETDKKKTSRVYIHRDRR